MTMIGIPMGVPALLGFTCVLISRKTTTASQGRGCQYPIVQTRKPSSVTESTRSESQLCADTKVHPLNSSALMA